MGKIYLNEDSKQIFIDGLKPEFSQTYTYQFIDDKLRIWVVGNIKPLVDIRWEKIENELGNTFANSASAEAYIDTVFREVKLIEENDHDGSITGRNFLATYILNKS